MIGETNAINTKIKLKIDEHTIFLMTDNIEDKSSNHYELNNQGAIETNSIKRDNRNSIYFNSTSKNYINIAGSFNSDIEWGQDWTIEYWIYPLSNSGGVLHSKTPTTSWYGILIGHQDQSTNRALYLTNAANNGSTVNNAAMANASLSNQWVHYAIVRSSNQILRFCNGSLIGTNAYAIATTKPIVTTIGGYWGNNNPTAATPTISTTLNGYLQDFRISNIARYNSIFTPPERFV